MRVHGTHVSGGVCGSAFVILWQLAAAAPVAASPEPAEPAEMVLEFRINGQADGDVCIALVSDGNSLWLDRQDFARLRLRPPSVTPRVVAGREYLPLTAIPGVSVAVDGAASVAAVTVPPAAFLATSQSLQPQPVPRLTRSAPGAFLNYELYGQHGDYAGANATGAWGELGVFGRAGVLTSTALASDADIGEHLVRLETTFARDFPESLRTLRIGDAISTPGAWGHAVRFGGLQWGTNFGIRPDLVTTPLLSVGGAAVLPSTVDVFINGQPVGSMQVPAGPFVIDRLPAVTGTGEVRLVVRNALGRRQVVTQPFYSSPALLQPGLQQYSLEIGAIRQDFGRYSNDYGELVGAATWRSGLSSHVTAELHGEGERGGSLAAGLDLAVAVGRIGVVSASLASGGDARASGWFGAAGFEHIGRRVSLTLQAQVRDSGFRLVGDGPGVDRPRQRQLLQTGFNLGRAGNLSFAIAHETHFIAPAQRVYSLTHNIGIGRGFLGFNLGYVDGASRSHSAYVNYTLPLADARNAGVTLRHDSTLPAPDTELAAELQRSAPPGSGYGYRLSASTAGNYDAGWIQQFEPLAFEADAARYAGASGQRLSVTGGVTLVGRELRTARTLDDSFALVDAGGIGGLTVFLDNQPVTRTDASGHALVRNLRPYETNRIGIDAAQLPIDTSVGAQTIEVVPAWRSGALVKMPVQRERGGLFRLVQTNGAAVPAGATVTFKGATFPVGLDGRTYVTGYDHGLGGEARWEGGRCFFRVGPPPADDPLPQLGDITCRRGAE